MNIAIAVKGFIIDNQNRVLLLQRAKDEVQAAFDWEIPGGRIELGEDPKQGLIREVFEETGIKIEILHPIETDSFTRKDNQQITMVIYLCKAISSEVKLSEEHSAFEWVPLEKLREKISKHYYFVLDTYERHIR